MQDTPKAKTFRSSRFYDDRMTARQLVAGTVPATGLADDELLYNGTLDGRLATVFPYLYYLILLLGYKIFRL